MVRRHTLRVLSGNRMWIGSIHFNAGGTADYNDPSRDTMILCSGAFYAGQRFRDNTADGKLFIRSLWKGVET